MMDPKGLKTGIILLMGFIFLGGCKLDDPVNSNNGPALTLHAEQNLSLVTLSWDPVNVTGFSEYIILQSTNEIPNSPEPDINSETTVLKRIDNRNIHSIEVSNTLFAERLCYKLYTAVDDRFLYSSTVCIDQDFTLFNGFNDRAGHEDGMDKLVMYDRQNARISVLDYKSEVIDWALDDNNLSFPIFEVSTYAGTTNVFGYDQSPPRLRKYKFPELSPLTYKDFGSVLFAVRTHEQFIFVSADDFGKTFQVLNRNNFNIVTTAQGVTGNRNIALFEGDPLIVIEIGETSMIKYSIDDAGKITQTEQISAGVSQLSTENTTANNDLYFIGGRAGTIVDRNGATIGSLVNNVNSTSLLNRFSTDDTKVISLINTNVNTLLEIHDITALPVISKIKSYDLPQASYADIIVEEHIIYVLGVTFASGQSQTFILKYPI